MTTIIWRKISQYIAYLTFFVPMVFLPWFFIYPYIVPKVLFFRSLVLLLLALTLVIYFYERKKQSHKFWTPLAVVLVLFLVSLFISTFVGVDWQHSFWNNHERMLGSFTILHYLIFFFVIRYLFTSWEDWRKAFLVFSGVGMLVVLIGIIQKISPEFFFNKGAGEVVSTLGNPIYLAGYGLFLFFISLFFVIKQKDWSRWYFLASAILGIVAIFIAGTRGTFVGLAVGIAVLLVFYLVMLKEQEKVRSALLLVVIIGVLFTGLSFLFRKTALVKSIPIIGHMVNISPAYGTARTRLLAWQVAIQGWQDRPVFGWGPNNYYYAYNVHYNPEFLKFGFAQTWWDNAHNVVMNTLATQGVVGVLLYLGIFIIAVYSLWRCYKFRSTEMHFMIVGISFLVAHLVHNLFVFENATSYLYFFLFLALVDSLYRQRQEGNGGVAVPQVKLLPVAVPILLVLLVILATNVNVALANNYEYKARHLFVQGKIDEGIKKYKEIEAWNSPYQWDIDWDIASDVLIILPRVYTYNQEAARELYDIAITGMAKIVEQRPLDVRARLAYMDLLRSGGIVLFEVEGSAELVEENLRMAEELSPGRQEIEYAKITYWAGTGRVEEAIVASEALIANGPEIADSYYNLAYLYKFMNKHFEALDVLDQAIRAGVRFNNPEHQIFAAEAYELLGRFFDALYWYDQAFKRTGNQQIKYKRDELSDLTKKMVPEKLEQFFPFEVETGEGEEDGTVDIQM